MLYNETTNNVAVTSDCNFVRDGLFRYYGLSSIALGIAVLMSFLEKRRNFKKDKCFGRPGVLVPINLINGDKYVLSHSAAFGCTVGSIFFTFYDSVMGTAASHANAWFNSFVVFTKMMDLGLQYYPLFVCVEYGTNNLYAPVIGLLYALLQFSFHIYFIAVCPDVSLHAFILLPVLVCLLYLMILFGRNIVITLLLLKRRKSGDINRMNSEILTISSWRNRQYVRILFSNKGETERENNTKSFQEKIRKGLEKQKACLQSEIIQRSSNRIAAIFVISAILLYQWFVFCVKLSRILQKWLNIIKDYSIVHPLLSNKVDTQKLISVFIDATTGSLYAATIAACIIVIANMYKIYSSHRRHTSRLLAGNQTFVPKRCWDMTPSVILAKNIIYPGIQIGHIAWGFLLNFQVLFIVCLLLSYFLIIPIVYTVPDFFYFIIRNLLPPFVITLLLYVSIVRISGNFLQSNMVEINGECQTKKILALTNWRAYQNLSYFMFFFYIFVGLFGCTRRIIVSIAVGFYYLARLDKCILIPGLEHFDISYMAYVAFLRIQISHGNPVVTTFCELLLQQNRESKSTNSGQMSNVPIEDGEGNQKRNSLARRRWFKAVTLLRNPDLVNESKPRLLEKKNRKDGVEDGIAIYEINII